MPKIPLKQNEIHIWRLRFSKASHDPEEFYRYFLSQDEKERADRLKFQTDRNNFLLARGHLRSLLSAYLYKEPKEFELCYGSYGKPYISKDSNPDNISFNLSHSRGTSFYALTKEREIGIDIEYLRPVSRAQKIIDRFFSEEERAYYHNQPSGKKLETFFMLWCRREAYTKALGTGFNLPESKIDISFVTGEKKNNIDLIDNGGSSLSMIEITVQQGYAASLAVSGVDAEISYRDIE